jgi:glycosyltransferase involved in cell wall biosynthesis
MTADVPELSIIIPARGRPRALKETLRGLAAARAEHDAFEVVVVDDGSPQPLRPVVRAVAGLPVSSIRLDPGRGRAAARNEGARHARGRRLLFLDSDSLPLKGLVRRHAAFAAADGEPTALLGRRIEPGWGTLASAISGREARGVLPAHEEDPRHADGLTGSPAGGPADRMAGHCAPWLYCHAHNVSVPREHFLRLGGFDEAFTSGHEDVEFGYRFFTSCGRAGGFAYDPAAACVHLAHLRDARDALAASAPGLAYFKRKHPRYDVELLGTDVSSKLESRMAHYAAVLARARNPGLGLTAAQVTRLLLDAGIPAGKRVLWAGAGLRSGSPGWRLDHMEGESATNLHLLGVATPFRRGEFDTVVHADLWRFLVPGDLSLAITEGLRIARRVYLVASADLRCGEAGGVRMQDIDYVADAIRPPVTIREIASTPAARILALSGT